MDTEVMLTTFDNPYGPFDDFISWWMFDTEKGYNTCGLLARIARYSEEYSTVEDKVETERAIDEIIKHDFLNMYTKVTRDDSSKSDEAEEVVDDNEAT